MSIQSQIDRITGEVNSQTDLIAQIEQVLVGKTAVGGGSGSGIIDVTELPTSGIDENAVYRLTEEVMIEEPQIYLKIPEGVISFKLYLTSLGVSTIPNIYEVDDLSNMLESDVATFSAVNIYILKSDGIAYAYVPAYGGIVTLGLFAFKAMGYDKGFTEDINAETEVGVYTTLGIYRTDVIYFIRENGEWKRISPDEQSKTVEITSDGEMTILPDEGKTLSSVVLDVKTPNYGDMIDGTLTEFKEEDFRKSDGTYAQSIRYHTFYQQNKLREVVIPKEVALIEQYAFFYCLTLKTVTIKKVGNFSFDKQAFNGCNNLTTINVPWAEGAIANAPWGATNATINYNYTEG